MRNPLEISLRYFLGAVVGALVAGCVAIAGLDGHVAGLEDAAAPVDAAVDGDLDGGTAADVGAEALESDAARVSPCSDASWTFCTSFDEDNFAVVWSYVDRSGNGVIDASTSDFVTAPRAGFVHVAGAAGNAEFGKNLQPLPIDKLHLEFDVKVVEAGADTVLVAQLEFNTFKHRLSIGIQAGLGLLLEEREIGDGGGSRSTSLSMNLAQGWTHVLVDVDFRADAGAQPACTVTIPGEPAQVVPLLYLSANPKMSDLQMGAPYSKSTWTLLIDDVALDAR
jgi:hypothetical protein